MNVRVLRTPGRLSIELLQCGRQRGQALIEYALILVLIGIVAIAVMTVLGNRINVIFQSVGNALLGP